MTTCPVHALCPTLLTGIHVQFVNYLLGNSQSSYLVPCPGSGEGHSNGHDTLDTALFMMSQTEVLGGFMRGSMEENTSLFFP